ncbi:MAG: hypothetical protein BAJALOKI3v1_10134 [Promethearchaeota archaeon]|nr:MAG: hypothetical protein BAJALOKI3v1_10134 [Candidatus Lokiarchaeota archaeon]
MFKNLNLYFSNMSPEFKIIVKRKCFFCEQLLNWLKDKEVDYQVLDYQDPDDFNDPLMDNETFKNIYCDMGACVESLPIVVKNEKEFHYGELWDLKNNTLVEERAKEIFGLS